MFHIGEVPGYPNQSDQDPSEVGAHISNRKMIQANLYTLCLNALISDDDEDEGEDSA